MTRSPSERSCLFSYIASIIGIGPWLALAGCGGSGAHSTGAGVDATATDANANGNSGLLWAFGGGNQDVVAVVESRSHTLYAGTCERGGEGAPYTCSVVALDATGHQLWRTDVQQTGRLGLVANGTGDVWAQGESLVRIGASGTVLWTGAPPASELSEVALAPDGTYFQYTWGPGVQLAVQAIGPQGAVRWSLPIGGHTTGGDTLPPTFVQAPAIDSAGYLEVPCQPCADGRTGIARVDVATGTVRAVAVVLSGDAGVALPSDFVTCDGQGNTYFAAGRFLASAGQSGATRWTTQAAVAPAFVGPSSVVVSSATSFVALLALSLADGSVLGTTPLPNNSSGDLVGLLAGGLQMTSAYFGSGFATSTGTVISDAAGHAVWSDETMDPLTAIPDMGRVYGIEKDAGGAGKLVAVKAPISGVEQSAWPMLRHDPGRTGSAAGSW